MVDSVLNKDEALIKSVAILKKRWGEKAPFTAMVCGSGWANVTSELTVVDELSYEEIPCLSSTTVEGHVSKLLLVKTKNAYAIMFQGRRHYYEGVDWKTIAQPVLLSYELGCRNIILTNAAGGISTHLTVGDLMIINDHINFMGDNPLIGNFDYADVPRFPDQSEVYSKDLRDTAAVIGSENSLRLKNGIYLALSGPAFETPAEIQAFNKWGADAVGMSTVPEAMIANAIGLKTLGISCISNMAAGISKQPLSHEEVAENTTGTLPQMKILISKLLDSIT